MATVDIYPYNPSSVRPQAVRTNDAGLDALLGQYFGVETAVVSSGRAGLGFILKHLGLTRTDHILVPDFLCRSVLYILNQQGFGVQEPNSRTKAVFLLHQWGYPQRMDIIMAEVKKHGWFLIEDCANSFGSTYDGQMVGSFGDSAIVSLAKFFPTYVGGALISKDTSLIVAARDMRFNPKTIGERLFDWVSLREAKLNYLERQPHFLRHAVYIKSVHFPRIPQAALYRFPPTLENLKHEVEKRKYNFKILKQKAGPEYHPAMLDEKSDIVPLSVPIFFPEEKLKIVQQMLKEKNIAAEILHFDINRNILNPKYKKCLAFPCHQYISESELKDMCDVISRV